MNYYTDMDSNDVQKILGTSLKELRIAKGLTQEGLAELIGKEAGTIYRIEAGKNFVKSDTLAKLSNALNIHPSLFFTASPSVLLKDHIDLMKEITQLLQTFPKDKLNDAYNILKVLNK